MCEARDHVLLLVYSMFKVPYLTDLALVDSRLSKELPWCQTRINSIVNNGLIPGKLERPNC